MEHVTPPVEDCCFIFRRTFRLRNHRRGRTIMSIYAGVDLALLLLIFFVTSSSFVVQPGVNLKLPKSPLRSGMPYRSMVVTLSQEGMVFFNDERMKLEQLRSAFAQQAHQQEDPRLLIEADARVPYRMIVDVFNMAMESGIEDVGMATRVSVPSGQTMTNRTIRQPWPTGRNVLPETNGPSSKAAR